MRRMDQKLVGWKRSDKENECRRTTSLQVSCLLPQHAHTHTHTHKYVFMYTHAHTYTTEGLYECAYVVIKTRACQLVYTVGMRQLLNEQV